MAASRGVFVWSGRHTERCRDGHRTLSVPQMYNFTSFTVSLNELRAGMEKVLAPTDCRLRPDIRSMENGNMGACLSVGDSGGHV